MVQVLTTGDENAGQEMSVPVPGRASALRVRPTPGSELPLAPLSTVLYVDGGTTTPLASQNGSIATPFAAVATAVPAAANDDSILLTPGFPYTATINSRSLALLGISSKPNNGSPAVLLTLTLVSSSVRIENITATLDFDDSDCTALNCFLEGTFTNSSSLFATRCSFGVLDGPSALTGFDCDVGEVTNAGDVTLDSCTLNSDITASSSITIRNVRTVGAGLTITAPSIVVDSHTLRELVFAGVTFVGTVSGYSGALISWGAQAATAGGYLNLGTRVNPLTVGINETLTLAGRRGVLCGLTAYSNVDTVLTAYKDFGATALTVNPNNAVARNGTTFVVYEAGESFAMEVTSTPGGQAIATAIFV